MTTADDFTRELAEDFDNAVLHDYQAPRHKLQHIYLKGTAIKVYVIDTNPIPTFEILGLYVSREIKGRRQIEALNELLSAAIFLADCIVARRADNIVLGENDARLDRQ